MAYPKLYSMRPMEFAFADSETSQVPGQESEKALDRNLDTYWEPTTTDPQTIVYDLANGVAEVISDPDDRTFATDTGNWNNVDLLDWTIAAGTLAVGSDDTGQYGVFSQGGNIFLSGHSYLITYTYTENRAGYQFTAGGSGDAIGTCIVGVARTMLYTATGDSTTLQFRSTTIAVSATLDDVSILDITGAYQVDAFALWIHNYNTDFGATAAVKLEYSNDNTIWTEFADKLLESEMTSGATREPFRIFVNTTGTTQRYWRFVLTNFAVVPQVAQFFLLTKYDVAVSNYFPEAENHTYANIKRRAPGGRLQIEPSLGVPLKTFIRNYRFFNDAARDTLVAAFDACRGGAIPLILNEDSSYEVVRIATETLNFTIIDYGVSEIGISFETLPYIADGAVR